MSTATQNSTQNGLPRSENMEPPSQPDAKRSNSPYPTHPNVNGAAGGHQPPADASSQPPNAIGPAASLMQLRQEVPPAPVRGSRKRKSPPSAVPDGPQGPPPPPQQQQQQQLVHQQHLMQSHVPQHMAQYPYPPPGADYSTGGLPPPHMQHPLDPHDPNGQDPDDPNRSANSRQLSTSKRAEQNRKAQRAFRERRDQHVKALESRSQLLDAALASADEANRRWEECRALVDQLRIENAALRQHLQQAQMAVGNKQMNPEENTMDGSKGMQQSRHPSADVGDPKDS